VAVESFDFDSSFIAQASYDADTQTLTATTTKGRIYTTPGITPDDWEEMKASTSPGRWYQARVQGKLH
jgi:hypothetical protein